jgi:hypothetical protein
MSVLSRGCVLGTLLILLWPGRPAAAQTLAAPPREARRQFITVYVERGRILPLHFREYPLEALTGAEMARTQDGTSDYHSQDGATTVDVIEYTKRTRSAGVVVYPFGAGNGASLAIKASYDELPITRLVIERETGSEEYNLRDGRAVDVGAGVIVSDRSAGWGLGSHAFVAGGVGGVRSERGDGRRYFAEGGGGLNIGPFGIQLAVKIGYNRLKDPRPHTFFTLPVALRGTVSF